MSPQLTTPLNRRQAIALLSALGISLSPDIAAETATASVTDSPWDLSGVAVLHDRELQIEINAELRFRDGTVEVSRCTPGETETVIVTAAHPQARQFLDTLIAELVAISNTTGAPRPA